MAMWYLNTSTDGNTERIVCKEKRKNTIKDNFKDCVLRKGYLF